MAVHGPAIASSARRRFHLPRHLRILPAGSVAHALNRGNDKRVLFDCPEDFELFLELVRWSKAKCTIRIIAYCLMRNHWHFVVWPKTDDDVTTFFHALTTAHAKLWRRQTRTVGCGHVYQDRYKAFPIFTERYYFTAMSYVEGNPYRAHLVDSARKWRWSSLQERAGYERGILDEGPIELPANWIESVDVMLPDQVLRDLRKRSRKY